MSDSEEFTAANVAAKLQSWAENFTADIDKTSVFASNTLIGMLKGYASGKITHGSENFLTLVSDMSITIDNSFAKLNNEYLRDRLGNGDVLKKWDHYRKEMGQLISQASELGMFTSGQSLEPAKGKWAGRQS